MSSLCVMYYLSAVRCGGNCLASLQSAWSSAALPQPYLPGDVPWLPRVG